MSAPAAIVCAKIILPEKEKTNDTFEISKDQTTQNLFDALTKGTSQGLLLAFNVGAILIVFIGLVALINFIIGDLISETLGLGHLIGLENNSISLEYLFGLFFSPLAWLMGINSEDVLLVGQLLGKTYSE